MYKPRVCFHIFYAQFRKSIFLLITYNVLYYEHCILLMCLIYNENVTVKFIYSNEFYYCTVL